LIIPEKLAQKILCYFLDVVILKSLISEFSINKGSAEKQLLFSKFTSISLEKLLYAGEEVVIGFFVRIYEFN
jgi:hypothetical protein